VNALQGTNTFEPPIQPEPPPFTDHDWVNGIYTHITDTSNDNDETNYYQSMVAKIVSDNEEHYSYNQYNSFHDDTDHGYPTEHDLSTYTQRHIDRASIHTIVQDTIFNIISKQGATKLIPYIPNDQHQLPHHSTISQAIKNDGIYRVRIQHAQNDGRANRSVTSSKSLLVHYQDIADYGINGVKEGETAITCTGQGFIPW
jgi:hypothetical protein